MKMIDRRPSRHDRRIDGNRRRQCRPLAESLENRQLLASYAFDFGPTGTTVAPGAIGVGVTAYNSTTGYGWQSTSGLLAGQRAVAPALTGNAFVFGNNGTF